MVDPIAVCPYCGKELYRPICDHISFECRRSGRETMKKRKVGYYWVIPFAVLEWHVRYWDGDLWSLIGSDYCYDEEDASNWHIGPRIDPPAEDSGRTDD